MIYNSKHVREGRCGHCGRDRKPGDGGTKGFCAECAEVNRGLQRNRYRRKVGIPLDAPLAKQGRPIARSGPQLPS